MVSTLIPSADLASSVTSRVLIVKAIDFTEGAPATGSITFELPWDVDVKADGLILRAGRQTLEFDANGEMQIRVPTSDPDTNPDAWFLTVKKSWAPHAYAIRVPVGTTPINLVDVPVVQKLPAGAAPGFFLTGAAATLTTGGPAAVTTTTAGGIANFDFVLPASGWARGLLATNADLNTMMVPGVYKVTSLTGITNPPPVTGGGTASGFLTVTNIEGSGATWAHQEFVRYGSSYQTWTRISSSTSGAWTPWVRSVISTDIAPQTVITTGTDMNTLTTTARYEIQTQAIATSLLNAPPTISSGVIEVLATSVGIIIQEITLSGGARGKLLRTRASNGTWSVWNQVASTYIRGTLVGGENLNTYAGGLTYRGQWAVPQAAVDVGVLNLPAAVPGLLDITSPTDVMPMQIYYSWEAIPRVWIRASTGSTGSSFQAWREITGTGGGGTPTPTPISSRDVGQANAVLVEAFRRRRGGVIGTGGKAAVALRFDHNTDDFQSVVLPLLRKYGLPASLALPADELNPAYVDHSTGLTWTDIQAMVLHEGIEVWSHSFTHADAGNLESLTHEIVDSRAFLMAQMPQVIVEGWMMVGVTGTGYDGFTLISTPEKLIDTIAGRLIMANYAVTSGHMGGYQRPLDGQVQQGLAHLAIDDHTSSAETIAALEDAKMLGTGLVVMVHPDNVGASARIPTASFEEILAYIAAERDAGRLEVLTVGALSIADRNRAELRHDMIIDGAFAQGLTRWEGAGWTVGSTGITSPTGGGTLRQARSLLRQSWVLGSTRELQVRVRSTAGATISLRVKSSGPATLDKTLDVVIPAGVGWTTARSMVTLPYTAVPTSSNALTVEVTVPSGASAEVQSVRLLSV